jgi:hypothetical protein
MNKQTFYGYANEREDSSGNKVWDITDQDDKKIGELKRSDCLRCAPVGCQVWYRTISKFYSPRKRRLSFISSDLIDPYLKA